MADHTPTPWHYRPHQYDDWGWIRATPEPGEPIGVTVAMARSGKHEDEDALNEHRRNKTDPYGANAKFIVMACNAHDQLVKALEFIRDGYARGDINHVDFRVGAYKAALDALEFRDGGSNG